MTAVDPRRASRIRRGRLSEVVHRALRAPVARAQHRRIGYRSRTARWSRWARRRRPAGRRAAVRARPRGRRRDARSPACQRSARQAEPARARRPRRDGRGPLQPHDRHPASESPSMGCMATSHGCSPSSTSPGAARRPPRARGPHLPRRAGLAERIHQPLPDVLAPPPATNSHGRETSMFSKTIAGYARGARLSRPSSRLPRSRPSRRAAKSCVTRSPRRSSATRTPICWSASPASTRHRRPRRQRRDHGPQRQRHDLRRRRRRPCARRGRG